MKNLICKSLILGAIVTISSFSFLYGCTANIKLSIGYSELASFLSANSFATSNESRTRYIDLATISTVPKYDELRDIVEGDCIRIPLFIIKVVKNVADMPPRIVRKSNKKLLAFLSSKIEYEQEEHFISLSNVIHARRNYRDSGVLNGLQTGNKLDLLDTIVTIRH